MPVVQVRGHAERLYSAFFVSRERFDVTQAVERRAPAWPQAHQLASLNQCFRNLVGIG